MLAYFLTLSSEAHSEAWTPVLLLLFTQMEKLQVNNVQSPVSFQSSAGLRAFRVQYLSSYLSPFQEERLRRFAAAVYPLLCQLWCADLRPEVVIASCQRWSNLRDIKSCVCSVQVCSVLRSLFLRIGVVYGISNFTNGVGHAEVMYLVILVLHVNFSQFPPQVENAASWCRDEKTIWAPLWFSQWAPHPPSWRCLR